MNITGVAIKKNRITYTLLFLIIALGIASYNDLPRNSMPPYTVRVATVVTAFPGASPERIEMLISDKIEKVAQEIPEVDYIASESRTGLSVVSVSLKESTPARDLQPIWDRLRRKIETIRGDFPAGIHGPTVNDEDLGVVYGIQLGLSNDGFEYTELKDYAESLRDTLIKLENSAKVEIVGVQEKPVFIRFDNARLAQLGLTSSQLRNIISSTNIIIPAGEVNYEDERLILEPSGSFESVEDIRKMLIPIGNKGGTVMLGDITEVERAYASPRQSMVKINGSEALVLSISLKDGANIVDLGSDVNEAVRQFSRNLPVGLEITRIASQDVDVQNSISDFMSNVTQSIVIVLLVMLLFLGLRTGLVVASLIPFAIVLTLLMMNQFGVGLNQVSLAALIMALGMLVDNAIVMAESMIVKMEKGEKAVDAALASSKELMIPLLISSLTTAAAFLSFFLAASVMGEIMGQLFSVITLALLSSWIMTLTIIPLLAVAFIRIKKKKQEKSSIFDRLNRHYNGLLTFSLKRPSLILITTGVLLILSLVGFTFLPFVFMPDSERNLITLDLNLPLGTHIKTTESKIAQIEDFLRDSLLVGEEGAKGVTGWSSFIGKGPKSYDLGYFPGEANSGYAHMLINTTSGDDNEMVIAALERYSFFNLPNAEVVVKKLGSGGGAATPIEVRLSGSSPGELFRIASEVKDFLHQIPQSSNVSDSWGPKIKKFFIEIDQARLSQSGLTNQDIAVSLNTVLTGYHVGEFRLEDSTIPIIMRAEGGEEMDYLQIESLNIFGQNSGKNVPLAQVATIVPQWEFAKILRRDLTRTLTVTSQLAQGATATEVMAKLRPFMKKESESWKMGYTYAYGGESEGSAKAMSAVADKLPLSMFIILFLLVLQFNSMRKTFIVVSTIPLGFIGVVGGLLITGATMSFTGFLGIISLAGIVINNAIVLIDRIQMEIEELKRQPYEAIVTAANERFRPILLTTFTTSLGLIPLWLGGGDMWKPMAIGIIFGLLFATVITLVFVPLMYKLMFKVRQPMKNAE
ncbi:Multidrug efflux pump subunit AcrB [Saccharicrinis carchari]|uniref:Multidrug efflux pump subunit AcrB n=1 Tax=Saccharicrinis carchari TaxID=1168039 RepID=A0A521AWA2_SACCC|nr:efflux RND transporter permease subunit [Saccharicrinis carchari]SMO39109.1 Multidrug efflux pump subunit AcrB [Saccharicrinis carchari]